MNLYKVFLNWAFDGDMSTPLPEKEVLLKYNSPITHPYLLKIFINNGKLNHYLNEYINNYYISKIEKEEMFYFVKKCIQDFKVKRNTLHYVKPPQRKTKLFDKLARKIPYLKKDDVSLLCDIIDESDDKDIIYSSMGIDKPKKEKVKKKKKVNNKKISMDEYFKQNYNLVEMGGG